MSRKPRLLTESGIYHIILRGNNQQNIFCDKQDKLFCINRLKKYSSELKVSIFGYCLMSNHIHILLKTDNHLSIFVQKLANSYVYYFNRKYERSGHLFQGRFKSEPVEDAEYFKTVLRYILQNPIKSGNADFINYRWSNLKNLIEDISDGITDFILLYKKLGKEINIKQFLLQTEKHCCMEYENKFIFPDSRCVNFIRQILKIKNPYKFMTLKQEEQKEKIRQLKLNGFSINQISRITGISKRFIKSA